MYDVNTKTARRALTVLEADRLIKREPGLRALVRETEERTIMKLRPGDRAITRAATAEERQRHNLGPHDPVTEITHADGTKEVKAAFSVELVATEAPAEED